MIDRNRYQLYLISVLLLLIYFAVRIFRIDALPLFIDEMLIVQRSEQTLQGNPLAFASQGKLLLPWVGALFYPTHAGWWMPRVVTLLLILPGAAAIIAMGKRLHTWQTGWFALLLITFTPMLHFHDRLVLTDTVLTGMLSVFTLLLLWTFDVPRLNWKIAILAGVMFVVALLAKSSAIVLLPLPLVAAIVLPKKWTLGTRIKGLMWVYGTMVAVWMPLQWLLWWRNINFFGRAAQSSTSGALLDMERIVSNLAFMWEGYRGYSHPIFWLIIVTGILLALYFRSRISLFLLAMSAGFTFALILFGDNSLYLRYWMPSLPVALLLGMSGIIAVTGRYVIADTIHPVPMYGVLAFTLILGAKFFYQTYTDPAALSLPHLDKQQYIESDSAGTAIPETAAFLRDETLPIVGAFAQCDTLRLYLMRDVNCLNIAGNDAVRLPRINAELAQMETPFYLVLENRGYAIVADITTVTLNPIATFERPGGLIAIVVYEVMP